MLNVMYTKNIYLNHIYQQGSKLANVMFRLCYYLFHFYLSCCVMFKNIYVTNSIRKRISDKIFLKTPKNSKHILNYFSKKRKQNDIIIDQ